MKSVVHQLAKIDEVLRTLRTMGIFRCQYKTEDNAIPPENNAITLVIMLLNCCTTCRYGHGDSSCSVAVPGDEVVD